MLRYMATAIPWPYPADGALSYLRRALSAEDEYHWAICLRSAPDDLIGLIGLTPSSEEDNRGFWIAEAYWGQGLMREAVIAVTDFAFEDLQMPEMRLNNAEPNVASHRLKGSMGADMIGVTEGEFIGGSFPRVAWRLTAEAWRAYRNHSG